MTDDVRQSHLGKTLAVTAWSGPNDGANRRGRSKKRRMLSEMLGRAGGVTVAVDGKRMSRRRLVAELLWEAVTTGQVKLSSGRTLYASMDEWTELIKFLYNQLDGPPKMEMDLTSANRPIETTPVLNIEQMFGSVLFVLGQHQIAEPEQPLIIEETPNEAAIESGPEVTQLDRLPTSD